MAKFISQFNPIIGAMRAVVGNHESTRGVEGERPGSPEGEMSPLQEARRLGKRLLRYTEDEKKLQDDLKRLLTTIYQKDVELYQDVVDEVLRSGKFEAWLLTANRGYEDEVIFGTNQKFYIIIDAENSVEVEVVRSTYDFSSWARYVITWLTENLDNWVRLR